MGERLVIDNSNQIHAVRERSFPEQPLLFRRIAAVISLIFHPVFIPVYVCFFLVYRHPYLFAGVGEANKMRIMMMAFLMFTFFPVITVLLLKALGFIQSIYLRSQKDRIIPLIACGVWYFWITYIWWNSNKMQDVLPVPKEAVFFAFATFISSWLALMLNIKMKISLHAISVGVLLAFLLLLAFNQQLNFGVWVSIAILVTGLVCTARLIVSDHTATEVYGGLITGIVSMLIAQGIGNFLF